MSLFFNNMYSTGAKRPKTFLCRHLLKPNDADVALTAIRPLHEAIHEVMC